MECMLTGLIPRRSVHQWSHLLTPRPLSIITTFCGVPIPSPSPCATYRDLNVPQLSHLDVGDSGAEEGQRISNAKSNYRSALEPSFHRCSNSVSIFRFGEREPCRHRWLARHPHQLLHIRNQPSSQSRRHQSLTSGLGRPSLR